MNHNQKKMQNILGNVIHTPIMLKNDAINKL